LLFLDFTLKIGIKNILDYCLVRIKPWARAGSRGRLRVFGGEGTKDTQTAQSMASQALSQVARCGEPSARDFRSQAGGLLSGKAALIE